MVLEAVAAPTSGLELAGLLAARAQALAQEVAH